MNKAKGTLVGLLAPVCWGVSVGMVRLIEECFGMGFGMAIGYAVGAVCAAVFFGMPRLSEFPRKYLLLGLPWSFTCSLCFVSSLLLSDGGRQTVEVGMVNYLWPSLTVITAILFNGQKARWFLPFGFVLTLAGLGIVLSGDQGFHPVEILGHIRENPLSYALAAAGALAWAFYSSATRAWGKGTNPTALIFIVDAVLFSLLELLGLVPASRASLGGALLCLGGGCVMGISYAAWTYGVQKGSITILAIASYFTPVLSCLFGVLLLGATLSSSFWQGVSLVVAGSLVCWIATQEKAFLGRLLRRDRIIS